MYQMVIRMKIVTIKDLIDYIKKNPDANKVEEKSVVLDAQNQ